MATKKDLVEAYSFSRRRLVTAFVSGAPGGREVEPARPGRMIVGGVALAILLVAGAAVAGALTDRAPVKWTEPGLVTDDHGALYVILDEERAGADPRLRPVINVTSAQLILGAGVKTQSVPDDELAAQQKGPSIGILNAPPTVPPADRLVNGGWISCTADTIGIRTEVRPEVDVRNASGQGFLVRAAASGKRYLIAEADVPGHPVRAYRYELPARNDGLDADLRVSTADQIEVPDEWLSLFPQGGALDAAGLGLEGWGTPFDLPGYGRVRVGDYHVRGGATFAATRDGFVRLTGFATAVLQNTPIGAGRPRAIEAASATADFDTAPQVPYADASWPTEVLDGSAASTDTVCGVLETEEGEEPAVRLATFPPGSTMLEDVGAGERSVTVEPGYGALVRAGGWNSSSGGIVHLVDDSGRIYSVAGDDEVVNLGYESVPAVVVPAAWNKLFRPGPDLSILDALCPPQADGEGEAAGPTCS
ncbi:MAG TPA: type VII secretion protein EccB [Nocardioides sp.]|nr:type VII secretion protein EccB [Nocardioides sp.]